jgi:hypothetical protein
MDTYGARCVCPCAGEGVRENEVPCEPAGCGEIATGIVLSCSPFWRTFVRSFVMMQLIEDGYRLTWATKAPQQREMGNSALSMQHRHVVTSAVTKMVTEKADTM